MNGTADSEVCIYCHKTVPLQDFFQHTTSCEMSSDTFHVSRNSCEIIGVTAGTQEGPIGDDEVEIISVRASSGTEVTHMLHGLELPAATPPLSMPKEELRTFGVGMSIPTVGKVEENVPLDQTVFPPTLPTLLQPYAATYVTESEVNYQQTMPHIFGPRMPLGPPLQTMNGHNLQPRVNLTSSIPPNQQLQFGHQSNYHPRATIQNNVPPQSVYRQSVPDMYSAILSHHAPLDLADPTSHSYSKQNWINTLDTSQNCSLYETSRPTTPLYMCHRATILPPVNHGATFQHSVPPVNHSVTCQHPVPPGHFGATSQHFVPPGHSGATFQHFVPPGQFGTTSQHSVPPGYFGATFQHSVPPGHSGATSQHSVNPGATSQHSVPPGHYGTTFGPYVPPTNPGIFPSRLPFSPTRPPPHSVYQNTMPIQHQGHIPATSHLTSPPQQFNQIMPLHPRSMTEVQSGQRVPLAVPNQIQPFIPSREQTGTNPHATHKAPTYRPEHYTTPVVPPSHSATTERQLQFQTPTRDTYSATSHLTFAHKDFERLSPGLDKTIIATKMPPLDTYATPPSQGFMFPYNPRISGFPRPAPQMTCIVPVPVPIPDPLTDTHFPRPLSAPHSLTDVADLRCSVLRYYPPMKGSDIFTPGENPPPLPPRKHQSTETPRPFAYNPIFEGPTETSHYAPLPPPYNPSFEMDISYSLRPPTPESELSSKCVYCDREILNSNMVRHVTQECFSNPDVAEKDDTYSDDSSISSGSDVTCNLCFDTFKVATIEQHMETCYVLNSIVTLSSEFENPDTMTQSGFESLEVADEMCRRCSGRFTMSSLKSHAEECLMNNPELSMDIVPSPHIASLEGIDEIPPGESIYSYPETLGSSMPPLPVPFVPPTLVPHVPFVPPTLVPPVPFVPPTLVPHVPFVPPTLFHSTLTASEKETDKCELCGKIMALEELPAHLEECRDSEEGKCPNCKKSFLVTILPDHTDRCQVGKKPVPVPRSIVLDSNPTSYRRCNLCLRDVPPEGHHCVPVPPDERRDLCGVCFLEMDPVTMETHRIVCLKTQRNEYTELHTKNWQRCLSCLLDVPPEDFKQHIRTCEDMLLGDISRYKKFTPNLADVDWAMAALTKKQKGAMGHVVNNAQILSNGASKALSERVAKLGFAPGDLDATLEWISFEAPIIIHVFLDKLLPILIADTNYRNQFETGTSHGSRDLGARSRWEDNIFNNIYRDVKPIDRVKYGVLNIVGDINGVKSCKQYGDSYFILQHVRLRTSFASADSSKSTVKIASCEHYKHVLNEYTNSELEAILKVATKKVPYQSSDVIQQYKEVQIHGPIEFSEHLECVVANQRHKSDTNTTELLEHFTTKNKCNMIWMY